MVYFNREPVWHASCSLRGLDGKPTPVPLLTESEEARIMARISQALDGVGVLGDDKVQRGSITLQVRRRASVAEKRQADLTRLGQPYRSAP